MTSHTGAGAGPQAAGRGPATGRRARSALGALGPDALALLDTLAAVRFLDAGQAAAAAGATGAARALGALRRAGLATTVPYRSAPLAPVQAIWSLTPLGARAAVARASHAAGEGGLFDPDLRRRARYIAPGPLSGLFMAHALATTDLYLAIRARSAVPFAWRSGEEARVRFRSFAAAGGRGVLVPDAIVAPADLPYGADPLSMGASALEIDRATMGRAAIERKLMRYRERVADLGRFGPVLFVADAPARRRWLEALVRASGLEGAALDASGAAAEAAAFVARLAARREEP